MALVLTSALSMIAVPLVSDFSWKTNKQKIQQHESETNQHFKTSDSRGKYKQTRAHNSKQNDYIGGIFIA